MTLTDAKLVLRIDTSDADNQIQSLIDAIPNYIYDCTGLLPAEQTEEPLVKVLSDFLIIKWYEHDETADKTIESLLKTLKVKTQAEESRQAAASE